MGRTLAALWSEAEGTGLAPPEKEKVLGRPKPQPLCTCRRLTVHTDSGSLLQCMVG